MKRVATPIAYSLVVYFFSLSAMYGFHIVSHHHEDSHSYDYQSVISQPDCSLCDLYLVDVVFGGTIKSTIAQYFGEPVSDIDVTFDVSISYLMIIA